MGMGALVAVITSMGDKNFIQYTSYTKKNLNFETIHQNLQAKFPSEEIQMYAELDSNWDMYQRFLN